MTAMHSASCLAQAVANSQLISPLLVHELMHPELGNTTAERPVSRHVSLEDLHSKLAFLTMTLAQFTWDWRHQPSPGSNINAATIAECAAAATAAMCSHTTRRISP